MAGNLKIGILALQGAVEPHQKKIEKLGATAVEVRRAKDLWGLSGIILPGGESTTMIHLLKLNEVWEPLVEFVSIKPAWGVCAGAILLSKEVTHPAQDSLGALPVTVARNAFGRQAESFITTLEPTDHWKETEPVEGVFIRAPRFLAFGANVRPLLSHKDEPVMVEYKKILASSFHPELSEGDAVHKYFLEKCATAATNA